jgi:tRNA(Ile2) C34 agmatinyltransferase TiaS
VTAALLDSPVRLFGEAAGPVRPSGGQMTLEERLTGTWLALQTEGAAECPACGSRMTLSEGSGACRSCGTRLS